LNCFDRGKGRELSAYASYDTAAVCMCVGFYRAHIKNLTKASWDASVFRCRTKYFHSIAAKLAQ